MRDSTTAQSNYLNLLVNDQNSLRALSLKKAHEEGAPFMTMTAGEMRFVCWIIRHFQLKKFIEIGTFTGYSGLWILESLPLMGEFWSFELNESRSKFSQNLFNQAIQGTSKQAKVITGYAEMELEKINSFGPFDGIFIDGNKGSYLTYLDWAIQNLRSGGIIIADNVFLGGSVYGQNPGNFGVQQIKVMEEFNKKLFNSNIFDNCLIPTPEGLHVALLK